MWGQPPSRCPPSASSAPGTRFRGEKRAGVPAPHEQLARHLLDLCLQVRIRQRSGMVHRHLPRTIQQHQRRSCRSAIAVEVVLADGHWHVEQSGIKVLAVRRRCTSILQPVEHVRAGGISVEAGWPDDLQSFGCELRAQLSDDRSLGLAVSAPVRPEKQQYRRTFQLRCGRQRSAEKLVGLQGRGSRSPEKKADSDSSAAALQSR